MPELTWDAGRPVDVRGTLATLRRGRADPAHQLGADGRFWRACLTPEGPGTLALAASGSTVRAQSWGPGSDWLLARVPALLGATDDWSGLDLSSVPVLDDLRRRRPGFRLARTELVLDALGAGRPRAEGDRRRGAPRVAGAAAALRHARARAGERDAGTAAAEVLLDVPTWEWHRMGVDLQRQRTIRAVATVAARLEECAAMSPADRVDRLRLVPGVGAWTAAETVQRAFGDPDEVSVGDYHLPNVVVHLFTGRRRGTDDEMLELLAPWAGQRQRVMRLCELVEVRRPRHGPRFNYTDIRAI